MCARDIELINKSAYVNDLFGLEQIEETACEEKGNQVDLGQSFKSRGHVDVRR